MFRILEWGWAVVVVEVSLDSGSCLREVPRILRGAGFTGTKGSQPHGDDLHRTEP